MFQHFSRVHAPTFSGQPQRRLRLDAFFCGTVALLVANSAILAFQAPVVPESPLQILSAGIERSEDAPFVSADFHFLPGDFVYCQFLVSGYAVKAVVGSEIRKISLTYELSPRDASGVSLTPPETGEIKDELTVEDKNWTPKRRASFLLPSYVAAGDYYLHLAIKDLIGNTSAERDIPFHMGGVVVAPTAHLGVQDFQFLRNEDDSQALEIPAFRPGDTVHARFNMAGFRVGEANEYHLSYGLSVSRPDGRPYLNAPGSAELSNRSFYPVRYLPGNISVSTSRSTARGQYVLLLTVRDLTGSQTYQLKRTFTVE